jgi:hypothetical protein
VYSTCRCDGGKERDGSAAMVTIAQRPERAEVTTVRTGLNAWR